jgi:hypothetical protein
MLRSAVTMLQVRWARHTASWWWTSTATPLHPEGPPGQSTLILKMGAFLSSLSLRLGTGFGRARVRVHACAIERGGG